MVFMSSFNVEGGGRGIHSQNQRLHYFQKGTTVIPSARGVDNHHNIPRQNYDNWGGKGGDGGADDGTG
ncbi:hypothetical protein F2Q69_00061734 [Brassica cretica]|nr:hypothetical protein DY000_02056061 [Brassica cretica]KAF3574479.1 hypothetical protein F2Q69_00061734 [Brassica cretica]